MPAGRSARRRRLDSSAGARMSRATSALPGTPEKIAVLSLRVSRRLELHAPGDLISDPRRALNYRRAENGVFMVDGTAEQRAEPGEFTTVKNSVESFGDRLHRLRTAKGWALKTLSRKTGISASALCQYENGGRSPIMEQLVRLADALDVTLDELVGRTGH